ncbi:hypothetical protein [Roseovarius sp. C03]|uniref:hypothetical protein n=1 Tax=Roseovarius sp. C03 TaxID=3449222 RepID=UPI003EDBCEA8
MKPVEGFAWNIGCPQPLFKQIRTKVARKQSVQASAAKDVPNWPARLGVCLCSGQTYVVQRMIVEPGQCAALAVKFQRVEQTGTGAGAKWTMAAVREGGHDNILSVFVMKHDAA